MVGWNFSVRYCLSNILLLLEFIYYGERKITVLKQPPKSGAWLQRIILIFPVDEPVEDINLVEFPLFLYIYIYTDTYTHTHTHTHCISCMHLTLLCASFLMVLKENTWSLG